MTVLAQFPYLSCGPVSEGLGWKNQSSQRSLTISWSGLKETNVYGPVPTGLRAKNSSPLSTM